MRKQQKPTEKDMTEEEAEEFAKELEAFEEQNRILHQQQADFKKELDEVFGDSEQICFLPQGKTLRCDICGAQLDLAPVYCPNCGSKRWNHKEMDKGRRMEDVHPWVMQKVKGGKTYEYWIASWREGDKVRNVHLGSCRKMSQAEALHKAKAMKAQALARIPQSFSV